MNAGLLRGRDVNVGCSGFIYDKNEKHTPVEAKLYEAKQGGMR